MTALSDLLTALGGTARVKSILGAHANVTAPSNLVTTVDDVRGVGVGPSLTGFGGTKPAYDAANKKITTSGSNWLQSAEDAAYDFGANSTVVIVAATQNGSYYSVSFADDPYTGPVGYFGIGGDSGGYQSPTGVMPRVIPDGTTRRLIFDSRGITGLPDAGGVYGYLEVWGRARAITTGAEIVTAGNRAHCIGGLPNSGSLTLGAAVVWQFTLVVDHQISAAEHDAILVYLAAVGITPTYDTGPGVVVCDGNSLTWGTASTTPGGATAYPARLKAGNAALSSYDVMNYGVPSKKGSTMLAQLDGRILSMFNAARAKNFYVYWEGINNMGEWPSRGDAGIQADVHDACLAAKNRGFTVIVCTTIPWGTGSPPASGGFESQRQALNTYIRGAVAGGWAHAVVDLAANPHLANPSDATYFFSADLTHLTDTGYDEVANNATYGINVAINALLGSPVADHLTLTTQPSSPIASGAAHTTQPVVAVQNSTGSTVTTDTSTVTATLVVESGSATSIGTLTKVAVAGVANFSANGLGATSVAGATAHWRFTDGALTAVNSATFTVLPGGTATTGPFVVVAGLTIPIIEGSPVEQLEQGGSSQRAQAGNLLSDCPWEKLTWQATTSFLTRTEAANLKAAIAFRAHVACSGLMFPSSVTCEVSWSNGQFINTSTTDGSGILRSLVLLFRQV